MIQRLIYFLLLDLIMMGAAACAQIIGIEDLPPLPGSDGGMSGNDALPSADALPNPIDEPALLALSVSGIAPAIAVMPDVTEYPVDLPLLQESVTLTATVNEFATGLTIAGKPSVSGMPSEPFNLALGDNLVEIVVEGNGEVKRVYQVNLRRAEQLAQYAYGKASNTGVGDEFGYSVAVSGDTLVVGAYYEDSASRGVGAGSGDNTAQDSGAVYVFRRTGRDWQQEAYLKASNTNSGDNFGNSVAISDDTIAVGAWGEESAATGVNRDQDNNNASYAGAVYVFRRAGTTWQQEAYIKASNTTESDYFGWSVALFGDRLAVGARAEDSGATGVNGDQQDASNCCFSGAVFVFRRSGTTWQQEAYVKASNTGADDAFGWSVALSEDTLAVGAIGEDSAATGINGVQTSNSAASSGAVYVFRRSGTTWQQEAYIKASNTGASDGIGYSVAFAGNTLAVGAHREASAATGVNGDQTDNTAEYRGSVYVFRRSGTSWQQEVYLKASNAGTSRFGQSVAIAGDTLAVGAWAEDSAATGINGDQADGSALTSGAAYVFERTGTIWQQTAYVKASNTDARDEFGENVALSDDTLVIGATQEDSGATGINGSQGNDNETGGGSGAVYVFH